MVRQHAAAEAIEGARRLHKLSLGLHLDLSEWSYRDGEWRQVYQVVPADNMVAVEAEILRQVELFRHLASRDPTHLDSHQHVHNQQPMHFEILIRALRSAENFMGAGKSIHSRKELASKIFAG